MRIVPPLAVKRLHDLIPGELARARIAGEKLALCTLATMSSGERALVALDVDEATQTPLQAPFFRIMESQTSITLSMGMEYAFFYDNLDDARSSHDVGSGAVGDLVIVEQGIFMKVRGRINGFTETCWLNLCTFTVESHVDEGRGLFIVPSWTLRRTTADSPDRRGDVLFSYQRAL